METATLIGIILILIALFFLCREVFCWYWKVNSRLAREEEIIEQQKKIIDLLEKQLRQQEMINSHLSVNKL